jgi:hypothetical protein
MGCGVVEVGSRDRSGVGRCQSDSLEREVQKTTSERMLTFPEHDEVVEFGILLPADRSLGLILCNETTRSQSVSQSVDIIHCSSALNILDPKSCTVRGTDCESALSKMSFEANESWLTGTQIGAVREYVPVSA